MASAKSPRDERSAHERERHDRYPQAPVGALKFLDPAFKAKQPSVNIIHGRLSECLLGHFSALNAEPGKARLAVIDCFVLILLRE